MLEKACIILVLPVLVIVGLTVKTVLLPSSDKYAIKTIHLSTLSKEDKLTVLKLNKSMSIVKR